MNFRRNAPFILLLLFPLILAPLAAASTPEPPAMPRDYVVDLAEVVRPEIRSRLNGYLHELEQKTTAQVVVLTVQGLDGEDIRSFGLRIAESWKLGRKGKDNGALLVVAVKDRKYTIEVGYGLEGVLPDSMVGTIGREYLVPYFKKGDYSSGIYAASLAMIRTIAEHEGVSIAKGQRFSGPREVISQLPLTFAQKVLFGILILGALILFVTHPRQCFLLLLFSQMGGGRGGWSGGSGGFGGFGGGGGGSFGGGRGGGFGGGGASGGW